MKYIKILKVCVLLALALPLAACQSGGGGSAAKAVEAYLQARVQGNVDQMVSLSCAKWEADARKEAVSFKSMNPKLEGVTCQDGNAEGEATAVTCQGKIVTAYNGETREWPLGDRQFNTVKEGGEWRMCGYK